MIATMTLLTSLSPFLPIVFITVELFGVANFSIVVDIKHKLEDVISVLKRIVCEVIVLIARLRLW